MQKNKENLIEIVEPSQFQAILIDAELLNRYFHTLLGNPIDRLKFYHRDTRQYEFYRTPGVLSFIINYYLHQGCLSTETRFPPEILYDELIFFAFPSQLVYEIISNLIEIEYFIPSGHCRRAFWSMFYNGERETPVILASRLIILSSLIVSLILLESINLVIVDKFHRIFIIEILIAGFCLLEFFLRSFIRRQFLVRRSFFLVIHALAWLPLSILLRFMKQSPTWLYGFLVVQLGCRLIRCVCFSQRAEQIVDVLLSDVSIYKKSFPTIFLLVIIFGLLISSTEKIFFSLSDTIWTSFNAFTSVGDGSSRPSTKLGLFIEFLACLVGTMVIPQLFQSTYSTISKLIDRQNRIKSKQKKKHLVLIEDEFGHRAIGQIDGVQHLPEILIEKNDSEFSKN